MIETVGHAPSPHMGQFLNAWYDWVLSGAPEENAHGFLRQDGLCGSLFSWCFVHLEPEEAIPEHDVMQEELQVLLGDDDYVFCTSKEEYLEETFEDRAYLNKNRQDWVKVLLNR